MPGVFFPQCRAILQVVFDGFGGDDSSPTVIHVLPKSVNVHLNGYRMADTFDMEFDAKALPFSPELIRAMSVEIFLFQTDGLVANPDAYAKDDNLVISGLIDDATLAAGGDGLRFRCSGRDYTSLMLDKQWRLTAAKASDGTNLPPSGTGGKVPVGRPLDQVIQQLVDECTHVKKGETGANGRTTLNVKWIGEEDVPTTGNVAKTTTVKKVSIKPTTGNKHSRSNKNGMPVKSGKSYWDVIYSTCLQHGCIVYVKGNEVVISKPQVLSDAGKSRLRKMSYGRNLAAFEVERHLGREQVPQIVATSYDEDSRETLEASYPAENQLTSTGLGTIKETIRRFTFPGVKDFAQLKTIAETIYHNLGRSESKIRFSTYDLKDLNGNDLLLLRPGDAVEIGFDEINVEEFRKLSSPQREARLRQLGYGAKVANLIATEFDRINQFRQPYYTRDVSFSWTNDGGLGIDCEAINFISVGRDDTRQ